MYTDPHAYALTFTWCRYYNIDIYHRRKTTKQRLKGMKDVMNKKAERTEFNDEEQRRYILLYFRDVIFILLLPHNNIATLYRQELMAERAKQKETELDKIKRTMMETGMVLNILPFYILVVNTL